MKRLVNRPVFRTALWVMIGAIYLIPLVMVRGAADYFLKIGDIKGESTDSKHNEWIDVQSFEFAVSKPVTGAGATRASGQTRFDDITVAKWIDKSSPILMLSSSDGRVFPKVEIAVRASAAGAPFERYMQYTLHNVLVTSARPGGSGSDSVPTESVSLNFTKIEMSYSLLDGASGETNFSTNAVCEVESITP